MRATLGLERIAPATTNSNVSGLVGPLVGSGHLKRDVGVGNRLLCSGFIRQIKHAFASVVYRLARVGGNPFGSNDFVKLSKPRFYVPQEYQTEYWRGTFGRSQAGVCPKLIGRGPETVLDCTETR